MSAVYEPATGNVTIQTDDLLIWSAVIAVGPGVPTGSVNVGSAFFQARENEATWAWFFEQPSNLFDFGQVFPSGLLQSELDDRIYELGFQPLASDAGCYFHVPIAGGLPDPVPEPGALALATVGAMIVVGASARRRSEAADTPRLARTRSTPAGGAAPR